MLGCIYKGTAGFYTYDIGVSCCSIILTVGFADTSKSDMERWACAFYLFEKCYFMKNLYFAVLITIP